MPYSEKKIAYNLKYSKDTYKRVPLDLRKEKYTEVKAAADAVGESVNGYIKVAIERRMSSGT